MGVREDAGEAAEQLRGVLAGVERGELTAGSVAVSLIEGAALAFEVVARGGRFDVDEVLAAFGVTESDPPSN